MQPQATQTPPTKESAPEPAAPAQPTTPPAPAKAGYGKRPRWQWILIYVVVAAIVYALIYFLWIHKSGGTGSSSSGY